MLKRFLLWLLVAWTLLALALWAGKSFYDNELKQHSLLRHQHLMSAASTMLHEHLRVAMEDTQLMAQLVTDLGYANAPTPVAQKNLARAFLKRARIYGRYDQIRVLNLQGFERLSINNTANGPVVVPPQQLQKKWHRNYVQQGLKLEPGQIYLSPLEQPIRPTLRLVTKLQDAHGEPSGLLVVEMKAAVMLNQFIELFPQHRDGAMLLNADGTRIVKHDTVNEPGWLKQAIKNSRQGSLERQGVLYSFQWLDITNIYGNTANSHYVDDIALISDIRAARWIMLVQSDPAQWKFDAFYHRAWFNPFLAALFLMVMLTVYLMVRNRHQTEQTAMLEWQQLENFRDLYENAPIGYITLTENGVISNINRQAQRQLEYHHEELVKHRQLCELVEEESLADAQALLESLQQNQEQHCRIAMRSKHGKRLIMSCCVSSRLGESHTLELGRFSLQNITKQVQLEQQLKALAHRDPLTGTANRRWFYEQAEREMIRARRTGSPLTAITLDIDHFKKVNDTYGHDAGDEVLVALAKHCQLAIRRTDILARFGGEEFVILLPDTALEPGVHKAELIRQSIEEMAVTISSGDDIRFTVSFGVATLGSHHNGIKALLKAADDALYQAKKTGRNKVCTAKNNGKTGACEIEISVQAAEAR